MLFGNDLCAINALKSFDGRSYYVGSGDAHLFLITLKATKLCIQITAKMGQKDKIVWT